MPFCPPSSGQLPNTPARTYKFSTFYRGPILLKFKTFIQFIIEDLGHDSDCSVTGKYLMFIFSLSSFLPFLLPFLSSSGLKKKINIKKAAVVCRRLGHLGDLSSSSRAL